MKKTLAIILAIVMVCSLSIAFADPTTVTSVTESNTATADVKAQVTITEAATVYSVDVSFDAFTFTYAIDNGTWDPEKHSTVGGTEGWVTENDANKDSLTVTNHSNAGITAGVVFDAGQSGVTLTFDDSSEGLATAVGTEFASAPAVTFTGTVGGTPADKTATNGTARTVGTITVTITAAA